MGKADIYQYRKLLETPWNSWVFWGPNRKTRGPEERPSLSQSGIPFQQPMFMESGLTANKPAGSLAWPSWCAPPASRLVKKYCRAAGIDPDRLVERGIGIHSLRKTAIDGAIRNGAQMHEVREFAGHADIRTTEVYFVRKEEDAEEAARRI